VVLAVIVAFVVPPALVVALFRWARRMNRAALAPRFARIGALVLVAFATLAVVVASAALVDILIATDAASEHSRYDFDGGVESGQLLGGAIAAALYVGLAAVVAAVPAAAWLAVATWRRPWRSPGTATSGVAPHR
jgi:hypothetical protein